MLAWSFGIVATIAVTEVVNVAARHWHTDRTWRAAERARPLPLVGHSGSRQTASHCITLTNASCHGCRAGCPSLE
jgi:hypothetical protein